MKFIIKIIPFIGIIVSCNPSNDLIPDGFKNINAKKITQSTQLGKIKEGLNKKIIIEEIKDEVIYLPAITDTIYGIKLDNQTDALIGSIQKIRLTKDAIYLLDRYQTKSVKKFNRKGKYIATIGNRGKGPGEYYEPTDFFVGKNEIIIYDQYKKTMNFYDLSGRFIKDKSLPFIAISFHVVNNNNFVFHTFDSDNYHLNKILNYSLLWADSTFSIHYTGAYREKDKYTNLISKNNMDCYNNKLYYHEPYNDTVYRIYTDGIVHYDYIFSFPNNELPEELLLKTNRKKLTEAIDINSNKNYVANSFNPIITDDFLYSNISVNSKLYKIFFSNRTNNFKLTSGTFNAKSAILFRPFSNILNCEGNTLIGYQEALELCNRFKQIKNCNELNLLDKKIIEFAESVKKTDNPILVFYKLKIF